MTVWTQFREVTDDGAGNFADDADFAATQASPSAADTFQVPARADLGDSNVLLEFYLGWFTTPGAKVAAGDRGAFTAKVVRVYSGEAVLDSVARAGVAWQPMTISDLRAGDSVAVRLSGMTCPVGGTTHKARLFYKVGRAT